MQSLIKRLMPAVSSALLAVTLSGCCVLQEAYYCIAEKSNNPSVSKEVIKLSTPSTLSYTINHSYQVPVREERQSQIPSYIENPSD